jgi:hypothetical protein
MCLRKRRREEEEAVGRAGGLQGIVPVAGMGPTF